MIAKLLATRVKLLIGSRQDIGGVGSQGRETFYCLDRLNELAAARLFHMHTREFTPADFPALKPTERINSNGQVVSGLNTNDVYKALSQHKVLKFLGGNPMFIKLAAPLLNRRTLQELHDFLRTCSSRSADFVDAGTVGGVENILNAYINNLRGMTCPYTL